MKKHIITTYDFHSFRYNIFASGVNCMGGVGQMSVGKVFVLNSFVCLMGFPGGSDSKESTCNVGDLDLIPGLGRSPGGGQVNPLQYSCLENPMDRGAWQAMVHSVAESGTTEATEHARTRAHIYTYIYIHSFSYSFPLLVITGY